MHRLYAFGLVDHRAATDAACIRHGESQNIATKPAAVSMLVEVKQVWQEPEPSQAFFGIFHERSNKPSNQWPMDVSS